MLYNATTTRTLLDDTILLKIQYFTVWSINNNINRKLLSSNWTSNNYGIPSPVDGISATLGSLTISSNCLCISL